MSLITEGDKWRAHKPRIGKRAAWVSLAALAGTALIGLAVWLVIVTVHRPAPTPAPVEAGPKPLTVLETAGIQALLAKETTGAHSVSGTIGNNGRSFGIRLSYLADGTAGSGILTAGGMRGDILISNGAVLLRGDQVFWHALGVFGTPPPPPGWVALPPDFLGGKVFTSPQTWTAALQPTPGARLDGDTYFSGRGDASAKIGDKGILRFHITGVDAETRTVTPAEVTGPVAQLGADHGPGVPLGRNAKGDWAFTAPADNPDVGGAATSESESESEADATPTPVSASPSATPTPSSTPAATTPAPKTSGS